ncbi:MAG: 2-(1,2-epoxy-1,2-dihydrophenyl)acetyl-CoA isomerase [Saprospiraceae bacterium]|nr:2-(1,2-epoxy-1,2-dihydrophenyl)acetyl-CoA isomerase [Saprospiraceae bacterium]
MSSIHYRLENQVAWLTLQRPEVFNSFNRSMALELQRELDACNANAEVRCVVLTGSGKAFCAGQDLQEVVAADGPSMQTILQEHYNPIIRRIRALEKPVIAAVNGVAAGAGANIALACDIVIASESASFIQAFSKIGLIPDSGGTFFLPRIIGFQKASALMMTGEKVPATEAERLGMVYKVFSDETFLESVSQLALQLAAMPTRGLAFTKQALNRAMYHDLGSQLELEDRLQRMAGQTHDYQEGVQAFLEKRKPVFKGR